MEGFRAENVINGTHGEMWFDGDYMAEVLSCKGELNIKYAAITRVRHLIDGQKMTGIEGKGDFKLHKISSTVMSKVSNALKQGKTPSFTIISKLADPDAMGAERVVFYHCKLDKAILADWEAQKNSEESYSFTFEDWEILDKI
ncbi:phage tail tube protein [Lacrimispora celerecrescens]|uniref:phage tail tube protein n=1 Tax=Lacrimispora celerecrescens TaxID=29354 RepID=UPI0016451DED|nr:phage tail tube protein [Lacrimispora celerecrescens]